MSAKAIYQIIIDEIVSSINSKELPPGARIPSIRDIKEKYNVSQITALRVFKELTDSGYIRRKMGSGYYVSEIKINQKSDLIICCVHPPRDMTNKDNWGNRVICGIMQECIEYRMGMMYPAVTGVLRDGSVAPDGPAAMASGLAPIAGKAAGILLDWRFTDGDIKKYIIPAVGNTPIVIVGRDSDLPVITVSLPNKEGATDAAKLSLKAGYKDFIICKHFNSIFNHIRCDSFQEELIRAGIPEENICIVDDVFISHESNAQVLDTIEKRIKSTSGKILLFASTDHIGRFVTDKLLEKGILFGRDAALISFNGMEIAYNFKPRLTTVAVSGELLGRTAVKALMQYGTASIKNYVIDYKIDINDTF